MRTIFCNGRKSIAPDSYSYTSAILKSNTSQGYFVDSESHALSNLLIIKFMIYQFAHS